jgi:hypothetical protein
MNPEARSRLRPGVLRAAVGVYEGNFLRATSRSSKNTRNGNAPTRDNFSARAYLSADSKSGTSRVFDLW